MSCNVFDSCRNAARIDLVEIHKTMDCSDLIKHFSDISQETVTQSSSIVVRKKGFVSTKVALTNDEQAMVDKLKVKPRKIAMTLFGRGINLKESLQRGEIPFDNFLRVPCQMLLNGGFTKKALKRHLMEHKRHWTERTVEGQLTVAFSLLNGLGCLQQDRDCYTLNRS